MCAELTAHGRLDPTVTRVRYAAPKDIIYTRLHIPLRCHSLRGNSPRARASAVSAIFGRLDQTCDPQVCRGATISTAELSMLHTVQNVVHLGRVTAVRAASLELEKGTLPLAPGTLLVDCTANGVGGVRADYDVFASAHIRLSASLAFLKKLQSAALVAYLEATYADDATKNGFTPHSAAASLSIAQGGSPSFEGQLGQFIHAMFADIKTTRLLVWSA